jgi:hypothetical protein
MPTPGSEVLLLAENSRRGLPTDTGVAFLPVLSAKGPTDRPVKVTSLADFEATYGGRIPSSVSWDYVDCAFGTGMSEAWMVRVDPPNSAKASRNLTDGAAVPLPTVRIEGVDKGAYANAYSVQVLAGSSANLRTLVVFDGLAEKARYVDLTGPGDFVAQLAADPRVRAVDLVSGTAAPLNQPAVQGAPVALTGGSDGDPATDADWTAALAKLPPSLGPGQVAFTGRATPAAHAALVAHAKANNRWAVLDGPDLPTESGMILLAQAAQQLDCRAGLFSKWVRLPGLVPGQIRSAPASAAVIGRVADHDLLVSRGGRPGFPAGGAGRVPYVIGINGGNWAEDERARLHAAGVNALRITDAFGVQIYGARSLSLQSGWYDLATVREGMSIKAVHGNILELYVEAPIDGVTLGDLRRDLLADLAIRESTSRIQPGFDAVTGPPVNTPTTAATRVLRSEAHFSCYPAAERVFERVVNSSL